VQRQLDEQGKMIEELTSALNAKNAQEMLEAQKLQAQNDIKRQDIESRERIAMIESEATVRELTIKHQQAVELAKVNASIEIAREQAKAQAEAQAREREARIKAETERQIAADELAFKREELQLELQTKREMAALDRENARLIAQSQMAARAMSAKPTDQPRG
jgi:hypothetical protein